jgi:iron complex transport system permease protein
MLIKSTFSWLFLILLLVVLFLVDVSLGSVSIPLTDIYKVIIKDPGVNPVFNSIITDFRLTKAVTCLLAGGALSLSGLQMQTLFRNPLAGPDVLGLSSGASLAVSIVILTGAGLSLFTFQSPWSVAAAASIGCVSVFMVMLAISRRLQDNVSLLIVGLMIGAATSSIVSVLQFLSKAEEMQVFIIWTFGSLGGLNWTEIRVLAMVVFAGTSLACINIKSLNSWVLGDRYSKSIGINIGMTRTLIILSTSILTGAVTAFCGPIAFVGLAVPHLVKIVVRSADHKVLIPAVIIGGGSLLLFCDIVAQLPEDYILPVNAITAMIGAPVVIWVILHTKRIQQV